MMVQIGQQIVAALQAELAVGGLGMGSLKSTQPAHYCTRMLAHGRCRRMADVVRWWMSYRQQAQI
jgi:hypothetical protein